MKRSIGFDVGTANFGVGVVEMTSSGVTPLWYGLLPWPIQTLVYPLSARDTDDFLHTIRCLYERWAPHTGAWERFQNRGPSSKGVTIEIASYMGGLITHEARRFRHDLDIAPLTASQWKLRWEHYYPLNEKDRRLKKGVPDKKDSNLKHLYDEVRYAKRPTNHEVDATLIATYRLLGNDFEGVSRTRLIRDLQRLRSGVS